MQQGILPSRAPGTSYTEMMLYATWFLTYVVQSCANLFNPQASFPFEAARELTKYLLPFIFAALCWSCCLRAGNLASTRKNGVRCHGKDWTVNIGQTKDDPDGGKASDKFGDRGDNILHHTGGGCFCHPNVPTRPDGTPPHVLHAIQIWLNISSLQPPRSGTQALTWEAQASMSLLTPWPVCCTTLPITVSTTFHVVVLPNILL